MRILGIDLSLRSSGLCLLEDKNLFDYKLIQSSSKDLNEEALLIHNINEICSFISFCKPDMLTLEDLSYDSPSGEKDLIAGQNWYLRIKIKQDFPTIPLKVFKVMEWRSPLFSKVENKELGLTKKELLSLKEKAGYKEMTRKDKLQFSKDNIDLILSTNIKFRTFCKLPENIQNEFSKYSMSSGRWDLTDAYFIASKGFI